MREHRAVIRRLEPADVELLKRLRLAALLDAPSAFGSSHEREVAFADDEWRWRLRPEGHPTFVWGDATSSDGMVVAVRHSDEPDIVHLNAMWVRPSARRRGVGDALVAHVVTWAAERSATLGRLHVTAGNEPAERLYRRHGFAPTGVTETRDRDGATEIEMEVAIGRDR